MSQLEVVTLVRRPRQDGTIEKMLSAGFLLKKSYNFFSVFFFLEEWGRPCTWETVSPDIIRTRETLASGSGRKCSNVELRWMWYLYLHSMLVVARHALCVGVGIQFVAQIQFMFVYLADVCVCVVVCGRMALSECLRNSNSSEKPTCVPWCGENRVK